MYLSYIQGGEPRAAPSAGGGRAGEGGAELHHAGVQRQLRHHAQVRGTVDCRSLADTHWGRWTHQDFPDTEVIINNDPDTGVEDGQDYAIWSITVPLTREDVGVKVWVVKLML